jgi:hypothetical protein
MRVSERPRELLTISRLELQAPPERTRATAEQPRRRRTFPRGTIECESREGAAYPPGALRRLHGDAPDQHVSTVRAELIACAAHDRTLCVMFKPQPNLGRIQSAECQIDLAQERGQRLEVARPALPKVHAVQSIIRAEGARSLLRSLSERSESKRPRPHRRRRARRLGAFRLGRSAASLNERRVASRPRSTSGEGTSAQGISASLPPG